jgi:hypothetical protein
MRCRSEEDVAEWFRRGGTPESPRIAEWAGMEGRGAWVSLTD